MEKVIKIMKCFSCKHYKKGTCVAFPDGIPEDVMLDKDRDKKECRNGIKYQNIIKK
jgi:hypothetical protein